MTTPLTPEERAELRSRVEWYGANVIDNIVVDPDAIVRLLDQVEAQEAELAALRTAVEWAAMHLREHDEVSSLTAQRITVALAQDALARALEGEG